MPTINRQLFMDSPTLCVGDVTFSATDDLQTHREKLARIVLDEMYQFVGLLDANGMMLETNRAALEGAGIRLDDIQGKPFWEARWWAVSKETQDYGRDLVRRARQGEFVRCDVEVYGQAAGEETITVDFSLLPVKDQNGKIVFLLPEGRNITEKKRAEAEISRKNEELQRARDALQKELATQNEDLSQLTQQVIANRQALQRSHDALQESEHRWRAVYENLAAGIVLTDLNGRILAANPALQSLLGYSEKELRDLSPMELIAEEDRETLRAQVAQLVACEVGEYRAQRCYQRRDGRFIWANASVSLIPSTESTPGMLVGIFEDITERKLAEERVRHLAYFDALTDLPNRVQFEERLCEAISYCRNNNQPVSLLILALERYKEINYTLGQAYGDLLLQQIGPRFRLMLHDTDTLAHFGGKHFAVLIPGAGVQAASEMAIRILRGVELPFEIAGFTLEVGASVGIAVFPGHAEDVATLMRRAEVALHRAQQSASGYAPYTAEHDSYKPRRLQLIGELRSAISDNQLMLYCQPKLNLKTREIVAMEALVRWQHPTYGLIAPDQFVPFIESTGLIGPLTRWIVNAAIIQCHSWQQRGVRVPLAINLSARDLGDPKLIDYIQNTLVTWGADPSWLGLEITESAMMAEPHVALHTLTRLSSMGFRLFIDDFGTGYSSLAYLQKLPINAIKIDKSFVQPMLEDEAATLIVRSTLELGHNLGLEVIAEGVESKEICERLTALGCDEVQGYYLSPPMPVSEFITWIKAAQWPLRGLSS